MYNIRVNIKNIFNKTADFFDPHRRGPLFTHYGIVGIIFIAAVSFIFYRLVSSVSSTTFGWLITWLSIGIHEFGHKLFAAISGRNEFWTICGGTFLEIAVPLAALFFFQRKGSEIQADICLFLLAVAYKSIGFYTGISLYVGEIMIVNAADGANSVPDWDYMHRWFGTEGKEYYMQQFFYIMSALTTALGFWLLIAHIYRWVKSDVNMNEEP
ncbi:MAG: hypothetical protein LBL00_05010 [Endomicrobium sp.]|jgi:hypothetical protein|nr:hypothetical protein [Endomicrobium sp.]